MRLEIGLQSSDRVSANETLAELGYDALDRSWNAAERLVDGGAYGPWANRLAHLMGELRIDVGEVDVGSFAVVADDHRALRWIVDPISGTVQHGDGDVEGVLTGTAEDLVLMLTGHENLGVLLRSGRVRHVVADESEASRRDLMHELNLVVAVLHRGLRDAEEPSTPRQGAH